MRYAVGGIALYVAAMLGLWGLPDGEQGKPVDAPSNARLHEATAPPLSVEPECGQYHTSGDLCHCQCCGKDCKCGPHCPCDLNPPNARGIVYKQSPDPVSPDRPNSRVNAGPLSPDGKEALQIDYPADRHTRNVAGSDGAGLCVFTSMHHAGDWQDDPLFAVMQEFMRNYPGGGYPEKVDAVLQKAAAKYGYPVPDYIHIKQTDLELLKLAAKNRLMPMVTYGKSLTGRYNGQYINHMVNLANATDNWFAVLDNNYIKTFEWLKPGEFKLAHESYATNNRGGGRSDGQGWAMILLTKSPPPTPKN